MTTDAERAIELFDLLHKCNKHGISLSERLYTDADRFTRLSRSFDGLLLDFSRTAIGEEEFIVTSLDWSPDNKRIAAGRSDGKLQIWDLPSS